MKQENEKTDMKLLPKEARLLDLYFQGLKYYLCAKLAGYKAKSKQALANTTRRIVNKYVSQAGKADVSTRAGGHTAAWWRDLLWTKTRAKARGDLKNMVAVLKMQGEAIGVLKAKEFEADVGATIIINADGMTEKKKPEEVKKGPARVVSIAASDD